MNRSFSKFSLAVRLTYFSNEELQCLSVQKIFEFHIHRAVRDTHRVDEALFSINGNVIFPNYYTVRVLAQKMNEANPAHVVRAGELNAMGLIDEINHYLLRLYEEKDNPKVFDKAYSHLSSVIGEEKIDICLKKFISDFPPVDVYRNKQTVEEYYAASTGTMSNKSITLEELTLLFFANFNPAFKPYNALFDDTELKKQTSYGNIITELEKFFQNEKPFGPEQKYVFDVLKMPIFASPNTLAGQLAFIKEKWGLILSQHFIEKISGGAELIHEEGKYLFGKGHGGKPDIETFIPNYKTDVLTEEERLRRKAGAFDVSFEYSQYESERFTNDLDWMPKVVVLAKNTYVWLSQLSKKYQRSITRLDQIPDEELDLLVRWNFTGLWLIGLWERSNASQKIKQMMGNSEAVPSAYSLYDYVIANDLGGEEAFQNLHHRAMHRGIRLAGDMVPNHMGIFSKWVIEHPEYFIQSEHSPYPNYKFTGQNISDDDTIEIRIEDGYWSKSDAAVVFQRIDRRTGDVKYFYHGNDGTNMPWNDTAQLNLLRADVREAVIQTILHTARKFSIIRFDAAMILAKKHYQRLWFPVPGAHGSIPSRSDFAITNEHFHQTFPNEFWREVVDRINHEMPNTLLLAEAFWLMEGYFVRTLGMHRVYNSAFMHMMMKEENSKYRGLIKSTLEFNPEILKRYVNFMSNPDEHTAIEQFGKDDKYFGVALMMVTMPGLPMFAHGQIEGFTEKYGMEYKRAYYDEVPDDYLIRRHEHEIFPIMKKRHLFSQVVNFELYDVQDTRGFVNENIFAYSNMSNGERALVFFHNKYEECGGWVRISVPKVMGGEGSGTLRSKSLSEALHINSSENIFYTFRDYKSNLEYIRSGKELAEQGMYVYVRAFEYKIFLDFAEIYDNTGKYSALVNRLNGNGTSNLQFELDEIRLEPFRKALQEFLHKDQLLEIRSLCTVKEKIDFNTPQYAIMENNYVRLCNEARAIDESVAPLDEMTIELRGLLQKVNALHRSSADADKKISEKKNGSSKRTTTSLSNSSDVPLSTSSDEGMALLCLSQFLKSLTKNIQGRHSLYVENLFHSEKTVIAIFQQLGKEYHEASDSAALIKILIDSEPETMAFFDDEDCIEHIFNDFSVADYINVHQYQDAWYFNKERFEKVLDWIVLFFALHIIKPDEMINNTAMASITALQERFEKIKFCADEAAFQVEVLKSFLAKN